MLDAEQAQAWLGALNDTRLVLGERLGVVEDFEDLIASLEEDDPRLRAALGLRPADLPAGVARPGAVGSGP